VLSIALPAAVAQLFLVRRMSPAAEAVPRVFTRERSLFFVAGVLVPWASLWIGLHWSDFYVWLFWEGFNYAWQPSWYRIVGEIIGYAPLIIAAALVALRAFYSPHGQAALVRSRCSLLLCGLLRSRGLCILSKPVLICRDAIRLTNRWSPTTGRCEGPYVIL
jgi:hypothetical protein